MIQWPNNYIFGNFEECEEGVLEYINQNFFLIDTLLNLSPIDFVSVLPADPALGDTYILEVSGPYGGESNDIMVWDGTTWHEIDPKAGWVAYIQDLEEFYTFDGVQWVEGGGGGAGALASGEVDLTDGQTQVAVVFDVPLEVDQLYIVSASFKNLVDDISDQQFFIYKVIEQDNLGFTLLLNMGSLGVNNTCSWFIMETE